MNRTKEDGGCMVVGKNKTTTTNEPAARKQHAKGTLAVPGLNRLKCDYAKL